MPVQVEQEQLAPCKVALTIQVPPEDISKAVDSVYGQFAKRTNVPGFRPGKAPAHLIKRFVDEGRVKELAMDQVLNSAFRDALRQTGLSLYQNSEPKVDLPEEEIDPATGFTFKATIATQPHVHAGDLEGLTVRRVVTKIKDEEIDRELERLREAAATWPPTEEAAEDGDRVRTTVLVSQDGQDVDDASFTEPTLIQVGANLPTLDQGLRGVTAGETKSFEFTYPDDFPEAELRGKSATASLNVSEVLRRKLPEVNDEFAQLAGFETLQSLRDRFLATLQAQADALADSEMNDELVTQLVARSHVHFPEEMVQHQVSIRLNELIKGLEGRGQTLEDYIRSEKTDLVALQAQLGEEAVEALSNTLVLYDFARTNKIVVPDKDVEAEVKRRAESESVKLSQMRRLLHDTGEIDNIRHRLLLRRVADVLREKAEIREVEA